MDGRESETKRDYEDVVDVEILNAPICDVCIVQTGTLPPPGFYRIHKTPTNKKADLNLSSSGNPLYLCIKKDLSGALYPITNFIVVFPDRNEYTPPGYAVVNRGKTACNLNSGTSSERIFLCYRKEAAGNPLTDVQLILPGKGEIPPPAFNLIEKSISGVPANLNTGTGGAEVYLCYRQHMNRLNCLLTEPTPAEEDTRARLRSIRRNSLRSFDEADRAAGQPPGEGLQHSQSFAVGPNGRPISGSMQPVSINTVGAGQNGNFRFKSVSINALTPPYRKSGVMEAAASVHAQSIAQHSSTADPTHANTVNNSIHAALPSTMLYGMPQSLPPSGLTSAQQSMRPGGSTSPSTISKLNSQRPKSVVTGGGGDVPHSVSFCVQEQDSPNTEGPTHPFEQDEYNHSPMITPNGGYIMMHSLISFVHKF
jgi:hypothetical protein